MRQNSIPQTVAAFGSCQSQESHPSRVLTSKVNVICDILYLNFQSQTNVLKTWLLGGWVCLFIELVRVQLPTREGRLVGSESPENDQR